MEPATQATPACLSLRMFYGLASQAHTGRIDFSHFAAQTMPGQRKRLAPKVLVSRISAPAWRYSS